MKLETIKSATTEVMVEGHGVTVTVNRRLRLFTRKGSEVEIWSKNY